MKVRYPDYYKKFSCIAGTCTDTCCAGWEISVDRASEVQYRKLCKQGRISNPEFAKKLKKYVRHGRILSEGPTCPFLDSDGLCEMYRELGEEALCQTCTRHPRHLEDYGDLHEIILLLSCPEAARLVLEENGDGFYVRDLPEKQGDMDGIDEELLELLLAVRDQIWEIAHDSGIPVDHRMAYILAMAHDVQRRLGNHDRSGIRSVLERYGKTDGKKQFFKQWKMGHSDRMCLMADMENVFENMDVICRDWPELMGQLSSKDSLHLEHKDFERVFSYFIYSFFLASLYDEDVLTKVKMAVLCTMMTEALYGVNAKKLDCTDAKKLNRADAIELHDEIMEKLTLDCRVKICHALARQLENSDGNRAFLEKSMKTERFSTRRIMDALLTACE